MTLGISKLVLAFALFAAALAAPQADAQQSVRLRAGGPHTPEGAPWVKLLQDIFIKDIKAAGAKAGVNVEVVEAWGSSVTKMTEASQSVQGRVLDVSYVTFPAEVSRFPAHNFQYWVPFGAGDALLAYRAAKGVYDEFPVLVDTVEKRFGQKLLGISTVQDYGIVATFPVRSLDDLKGRKFGGVGPTADYLTSAGAVPIASSMPEMYMNIQTRLTDGHVIIPQAIVGLRVYEVAKFWNVTNFGATSPHGLVINLDTWKTLPPALQQAATRAGNAWAEALAKNAKDTEESDLKKWRAAGGEVLVLPAEERRKWAARFSANYVAERAKKADSAGMPGTKIVAAYLRNLEKLGYQSPRKWDVGAN